MYKTQVNYHGKTGVNVQFRTAANKPFRSRLANYDNYHHRSLISRDRNLILDTILNTNIEWEICDISKKVKYRIV